MQWMGRCNDWRRACNLDRTRLDGFCSFQFSSNDDDDDDDDDDNDDDDDDDDDVPDWLWEL